MKLYAINAGYMKQHETQNWYYVFAESVPKARKKFTSIVGWLDIFRIVELSEKGKEQWLQEYDGYNKSLIGGLCE